MTKKEKQLLCNAICEERYTEMGADWNINHVKLAQLRRCSADVYETDSFYVLRSYASCVAFIDKSTGMLYDVLRAVYGYTVTSAQHIAKFSHDYHATDRMTWREV